MTQKEAHFDTRLAHYGEDPSLYHGAVVPPIFQNSLFTFESAEAIDEAFSNMTESCIYTRGNNPTVQIVEQKIAALEGGEKAKLFASGMAAITAGILSAVTTGDHIICVKSAYGPTNNFIKKYLSVKFGITSTFVDGTSLKDFEDAIEPRTALIYLESPSSGIFAMQDLNGVASLAKSKHITTMIDNTWATPLYQNPIAHGIDIVAHSASKYLSGHSDVVAGVLISTTERINNIFLNEFLYFGGKIAPFEAWLILRGLRTFSIRMERHSKNAKRIIEHLENHPKVLSVLYPGHSSYPQRDLADKYLKGFSGLLSITLTTDAHGVKSFLNALQIFQIGVSWGGFESLAYAPIISLEKELDAEQLQASGIHPGLVRLSIGLEHSDDLIADLEQAFRVLDSLDTVL
jgi:cystathionine beta-lyase